MLLALTLKVFWNLYKSKIRIAQVKLKCRASFIISLIHLVHIESLLGALQSIKQPLTACQHILPCFLEVVCVPRIGNFAGVVCEIQ